MSKFCTRYVKDKIKLICQFNNNENFYLLIYREGLFKVLENAAKNKLNTASMQLLFKNLYFKTEFFSLSLLRSNIHYTIIVSIFI